MEVFAAMAHAEGFDLEEPAKAYLFSVCDKMRSCKDFSNARSMRDLLNQVAVVMAVKFGAGWTINADAIRIAYEKSESGLAVPSPIGFFS